MVRRFSGGVVKEGPFCILVLAQAESKPMFRDPVGMGRSWINIWSSLKLAGYVMFRLIKGIKQFSSSDETRMGTWKVCAWPCHR